MKKKNQIPNEFAVEIVPIASLNPARYNPRRMSPERFESLKQSMREFGNQVPVVVNTRGRTIVGGHQRIRALREMGIASVPVRWVDLTASQERVLNLALNNDGDFDHDSLSALIGELKIGDIDLAATGLTDAEVAQLLGQSTAMQEDAARSSLVQRFGVPPFSVLDARQGYWQARKAAWIALGIRSELGRGEDSAPGGSPRPLDRKKAARAKATPGGRLMPAARTRNGRTVRGDGRGRPIA